MISKKKAFLEAFVLCRGNMARAAICAETTAKTHRRWLREDEEYRSAFAESEQEAAKLIEDEAIRRAVEGVERPLVHRGRMVMVPVTDELGRPVYDEEPITDIDGAIVFGDDRQPKMKRVLRERPLMETEYSDSLMQTLLRGWMPHKYGRTEVTGPGGGPLDAKIEVVFKKA